VKKVLVVDDEELIGELLKNLLDMSGYSPIICKNGNEALLHLDEADVLITDFNMPGMNGAELAKIAKQRRSTMPVLIMTGDPDDVPNNHSANQIIAKPFMIAPFLNWLEKVTK